MIIKSVEEVLIYESPDGGKTVYSRKLGETKSTLVSVDTETVNQQKENARWLVWRDILILSKTNPSLASLVHRAEMFYNLIKEENK